VQLLSFITIRYFTRLKTWGKSNGFGSDMHLNCLQRETMVKSSTLSKKVYRNAGTGEVGWTPSHQAYERELIRERLPRMINDLINSHPRLIREGLSLKLIMR
jgi:hypothetical protein